MSQKRIETAKFVLYSSSSRQRNTTVSPNVEKKKKIGDYLLLSTIGRGTFSKVKLGLHIPTKQRVAIKILDKEKINDEADIERIRREIHILQIVKHPNIVQLYETLTSDNNIYIIMEYIEGKDLFQYIYSVHHLTEFKSSQLFRQLISCLEYIHKLGIVHRDIKPENILLNKNKKILKLVDFGLSNTYEKDELVRTACGSPCYAAPEMISGKDYEGFYSDLWSCGVVLYCMLVGRLPFDDEDIKKLYHNIKMANYVMPNFLSHYAQDILRKILVTNPKKRIKLEELKRHPFLLLSEKAIMYKGINNFNNGYIQVDYDIVQKIKEKYFSNDEDCNINCDIIVENIKNNLHNKITTIYYLLLKEKNEKNSDDYNYFKNKDKNKNNENNSTNNNYNDNKDNKSDLNSDKITLDLTTNKNRDNNDNNYNNVMNNEQKNEKSPSFAKMTEKTEKIKNSEINSEENENEKFRFTKKIENNSNNQNNEKRFNIRNIKKILFNNSNKNSENNSNNKIDNNNIKDDKKENITINNDNNEKRFNILVINNFMSEKESSNNNNYKNYKNIPTLNNKIYLRKNINKNSQNEKENGGGAIKNGKESEYEKIKSIISENTNTNNSKNKKNSDIIIKKLIKKNKNNSKDIQRLHSVNFYQKNRIKSSNNNYKMINNFTASINTTNKNHSKDKSFHNISQITFNNKNNAIGNNGLNLKVSQKCKKINFDSLDNNFKINNNLNCNNINAIKNENIHRHKYILSKITMNKDKKLNKSISFGKNKINGNNKFKKYIKKLFEEENYSFNNDISKNKSLNLTPVFHHNIYRNKNFKINKNLSNKNSKNNKNILFINVDSELSKLNKTTNILEFYKTNELKKYNMKNIFQNINKTNYNNISKISIDNQKQFKNNMNVIKKNNSHKNKNDFEEKLVKYMKQRFKNCIKKKYSKDNKSTNNIKINSNFEKYSKSGAKSPNSLMSKEKSETYSNKSCLKSNNKIIYNKEKNNIKYKYSNNSTKNNSIIKNKKNKNNINLKNNKNFLFAADFSNVVKKNISRNKNTKNKNALNNINNYNYFINNDLINNMKNNFYINYTNKEKKNFILNKENRTAYHSKGKLKSKFECSKLKYSPLNNNKKILNKKAKSISKKKNPPSINLNITGYNFYNFSNNKILTTNNSKNKKAVIHFK